VEPRGLRPAMKRNITGLVNFVATADRLDRGLARKDGKFPGKLELNVTFEFAE